MDHQARLDAIAEGREGIRAAEARLHGALVEAIGAGVPQMEVARVLGVSRVTLWRRLRPESESA